MTQSPITAADRFRQLFPLGSAGPRAIKLDEAGCFFDPDGMPIEEGEAERILNLIQVERTARRFEMEEGFD